MSGNDKVMQRWRRGLYLLFIAASGIACSNTLKENGHSSSPSALVAPPFDSLAIVVFNRPMETVRLIVAREGGNSTTTLVRLPGAKQSASLLDSIGPVRKDPEMVRELLKTFDLWALNAPNAPGAACTTVYGERSCMISKNDYSIVMMVRSGQQIRVQRYIDLESSTANPMARALGDFVLSWAHKRAGRG
jgi:hypothetical protein